MSSNIKSRKEDFGVITYDSSKDTFVLVPNDSFDSNENYTLSGPLTAHWTTTLRCNARCSYCYLLPVLKKVNEKEDILSKGDAREFIRSFAQSGGFRLYLTGGEPTLHPFIDEIMDYANEEKIKVVVNTNGIIVPERVYESVRRNGASLSFSLDSHSGKEHDEVRKQKSFDSIVEMLGRCRNEGVDTRVISVASTGDVHYWEEFGRFLSEAGVGRWFIQGDNSKIVEGLDSDLESRLRVSFPSLRVRVIPAIYDSFLYVLPDGTACSNAWGDRVVYGKVPQDSVKDIWKKNSKNGLKDHLGIIRIEN